MFVQGLNEKSKGNEHFLDLLPGGRIDKIRQDKLKRFRDSITTKLSTPGNDDYTYEDNRTVLNIPWKDNGDFQIDDSDYARYLRTLNASIFLRIKSYNERATDLTVINQLKSCEQILYNEVLIHTYYYSKILATNSLGFEYFFDHDSSFKHWLTSAHTNEHYPYVIFGSRASGKTLLCTKLVQYLLNTLGKTTYCILRYFNLTSKSRHLIEIFSSICKQMSYLPNVPTYSSEQELNRVEYYQSILLNLSKTQKPLILMIDGIEEILPQSQHASSNAFYQALLQLLPPKVIK